MRSMTNANFIIGRGDGHAHFDFRALARLRLDRKQPMHEPHPLAHTDEAERAIGAHPLRIEADTVIGADEPKLAAFQC